MCKCDDECAHTHTNSANLNAAFTSQLFGVERAAAHSVVAELARRGKNAHRAGKQVLVLGLALKKMGGWAGVEEWRRK